MPSNTTRLPGQYLLGQLSDGLHPFPYRSSVYRLLGLPSRPESKITYRRQFLPVGFRYEQQGPVSAIPSPAAEFPPAGIQAPSIPEDATFDTGDTPSPSRAFQMMDSPRFHSPAGFRARQAAPEITEKRPHVPLETHTDDDPSLPDRPEAAPVSDTQGAHSEELKPPSLPVIHTSTKPAPAPAAERVSQTEPVAPASQETPETAELVPKSLPTATRTIGLSIPGFTDKRAVFAALSRHLVSQESPEVPEIPSMNRQPAEPVQPHRNLAPVEETPSLSYAPIRKENLSTQKAPAKPAVQPDPGPVTRTWHSNPEPPPLMQSSRSRVRAADQIEHLRQVVTTMASKQGAAQNTSQEKPPDPPAPPARTAAPQSIVVVRQAGASPRTPRAFWATSLMRSTHLRMLR